MSFPDLPAGVTDADIERRFGDPPKECVRCGWVWVSEENPELCDECWEKEKKANED